MTRRLLLSYLAVTVVVLLLLEIPLAMFYSQRELERFTNALERDATVLTMIYEDDLEQGRTLDPGPAERYTARTGARVVVVDERGVSLVDTSEPTPRDFSTRPEIIAALGGARATGTRSSSTLGTDLVYVALPVGSSGTVHGAVRLTLDTGQIDQNVHRFWLGLAAMALVVLAVVAMIGWAIARWITQPIRALQQSADRFARGDLSADVAVDTGPPELRQLSGTMSDMAVRLDAMLAEQREFVADASHQLRTPLTAMRLRLENLQARLPGADAAEVEAAIDETTRLARLVSDLLQLARADESQDARPTDLAAVATDRIDTWTAVAEMQGVRIALDVDRKDTWSLAVPGAVEQILDNTLDNALVVTPEGGEVKVVVRRDGAMHSLKIVDHGPGLTDDEKAKATHRFWRGASTAPGTGLGLAIALALARGSGGTLELSDTPGGGLTVELRLPPA